MTIHQLFDLTGKIAVVTGGATGLGRQMAMALAEAGASVVVASRNLDRSRQFVTELERLGETRWPISSTLPIRRHRRLWST